MSRRARRVVGIPLPGPTIRQVREALGVTQEQLGRLLSRSELTILRAEKLGGDRMMRLALIGLLVTEGKPYGILWPER